MRADAGETHHDGGMRPFHLVADVHEIVDGAELAARAQRAEQQGYHSLVLPDHLLGQLSPVVAMATAAAATSTVRLSAFVMNNHLRHPAVLTQDLASIDVLSGGRLDVAIGAGWNKAEYDAIGMTFDPTPIRQARLAESIAVLKGLFAGSPVELRRRALHDHRLRRRTRADATPASTLLHRRWRSAHAEFGRSGSGHRRVGASHSAERRRRCRVADAGSHSREDRLGARRCR